MTALSSMYDRFSESVVYLGHTVLSYILVFLPYALVLIIHTYDSNWQHTEERSCFGSISTRGR